jgi:hypothetical protein
MQRANLDGQNLCSQIYGRDWIPEPPCHSIFKRRGGGGVRNWARISRAARIKAPRSMTLKRFRTPFAILPLIKGGGGVRNGGVSRKGPIPVVSPFVSFSSPPVVCSPPDRAPRLVPLYGYGHNQALMLKVLFANSRFVNLEMRHLDSPSRDLRNPETELIWTDSFPSCDQGLWPQPYA